MANIRNEEQKRLEWSMLLDNTKGEEDILVVELQNKYKNNFYMVGRKYYSIDVDTKDAIILETMYMELLEGDKYKTEKEYINSVIKMVVNKYNDIIRHQQSNKEKIHYVKDSDGLPLLSNLEGFENYDNILVDRDNSIQEVETKIAIEQDIRLTQNEKILLRLFLTDDSISDSRASRIIGVSRYKIGKIKCELYSKLKQLNIL